MEKMGTADSEMDQLFEQKKRVKNPLVPSGLIHTLWVSILNDMDLGVLGAEVVLVELAVVVTLVADCLDVQIMIGMAVSAKLVGIWALLTAGVLTAGLISFKKGNSHLGQKLMRARVVVQGATVALMLSTAYYYGEK
ncbi:RING-H2 finger protein ATL48 [Vitis vinifera]|uniref:RING-H2 finger protein ATL48 n=1 Tax=Vitis vinifera TaxID=29760 RepID=A0A438JIY5_VITVI|nr:RING-H2 finger protein ATL48 [Vitis vinifera]